MLKSTFKETSRKSKRITQERQQSGATKTQSDSQSYSKGSIRRSGRHKNQEKDPNWKPGQGQVTFHC